MNSTSDAPAPDGDSRGLDAAVGAIARCVDAVGRDLARRDEHVRALNEEMHRIRDDWEQRHGVT